MATLDLEETCCPYYLWHMLKPAGSWKWTWGGSTAGYCVSIACLSVQIQIRSQARFFVDEKFIIHTFASRCEARRPLLALGCCRSLK